MNGNTGTAEADSDGKWLRRAYAAFATGVTVVTVGGETPHAMTANSFTSVSLDPPLVLVCVDRGAVMHGILTGTARFGVSVLAADQEAVARHFADRRRPLGMAQFDRVPWRAGRASGAPLLTGAAAHFECAVWRAYDGGDHTVFLGRVLSVDRCTDEDVLLFINGRFSRSGRPEAYPSPIGVAPNRVIETSEVTT